MAKVCLPVVVRDDGRARIESVPLERLVEVMRYEKRVWMFEDGCLVLEGIYYHRFKWALLPIENIARMLVRGCKKAFVDSVPLKEVVRLSGLPNRYWEFIDGWIILEAF
jgi:hypothetical protein